MFVFNYTARGFCVSMDASRGLSFQYGFMGLLATCHVHGFQVS